MSQIIYKTNQIQKKNEKKENNASNLEKGVEMLLNREDEDEEISNIMDLIKLENNNDFYRAFEKQISYLLKLGDDINYFDFKYQRKFEILEFFVNYIKASGLSIYDKNKKIKKDKKAENKEIKIEKNIKEIKIINSKNKRSKSSVNYEEKPKYNINNIFDSINKNKSDVQKINNISHKLSKSSLKISYSKSYSTSNNESKSFKIDSKYFFSFSEKTDLNISSELNEIKDETKKENSNIKIYTNIEKDKQNNLNDKKINNKGSLNNINKSDNSKEKNQSIKKEKVIKEINLSNDEKKEKNLIKFYDEISNIEGASFEFDTIKFIYQRLLSVSEDKNYSLLYDFRIKKEQLNKIFKDNKLFPIDDIQMDFVIINLKISDLIKLLIDLFPLIHSNSKMSFDIKEKNTITFDDLYRLDSLKRNSDERIDIIGKIGINIFNEEEKCYQLLKYTKLIHNINKMIINNSEQLQYLLELLHLTGENKKILLFITDCSYLNFKNNINNNFQKIQNQLNVDCLLLYRNKNLLFRTKMLRTLLKQFKKAEKANFNKNLDNEFDKIIKNIFQSNIYEGVVRKLSKIEKKIYNIKNDLYNYVIKNDDFKKICANIIEIIDKNDLIGISMQKYNEIKDKLFKSVIKSKIEPEAKMYIIYEKKNETNESIIKFLKYKSIPFKDGNSFEILNDKKLDTYKIVLFFISPKFINDNISQFINLKESFQINKLNHYIFYFEKKKLENKFNEYQAFTQFNFKYTNNIKELEKIIIDLFKNIKQNELYKKYIQLIEDELFYKFIIEKYLYLFNKSIYSKPKKFKKNELLFIKISQDLQFLKNFEFNENIFLAEEIINEIKAINNNNDIKKIIDGFIGYSNIILDIKHILIEFENNIDDKIRINGEKRNNDNVAGNIHNIDNDKNNKNEKNSNNSKCKVEIINSDDYFDLKKKKLLI